MAIATASKKGTVIVIDPDEDKAREVKETLERSMEKIAIINTKCLTVRMQEINELMHDIDYQKIFYGCNMSFFNKMVEDFNLNFKDGEVAYIGWRPDISKIVINYWNYFWKNKGFEIFPPTISRREESFGQEL